ncbi:MAG: hypothetical protein FJ267_01785, partial [Planctomycetes bacterium]|nr:hypothetical protein [Planctomycetota bacterium]
MRKSFVQVLCRSSFLHRLLDDVAFVIFGTIVFCGSVTCLTAEDGAETEFGYRPGTIAITGATITTRSGTVIEHGQIVIRQGRIVSLEKEAKPPVDAIVIDGRGHYVYPGFIDAGTSQFLDDTKPQPIAGRSNNLARYALAEMRTDDHSGLTPEYQAADHLKRIPTELEKYRKEGFVAAQILPTGRIASGQSAVMTLASTPTREAVVRSRRSSTFDLSHRGGNDYPATSMGVHAHLRQTFLDAVRHSKHRALFEARTAGIDQPPFDPVLDTFFQLTDHQLPVSFVAQTQDEIERALNFATEHKLKAV